MDITCCICLEDILYIKDKKTLNCEHIYHKICIKEYLKFNNYTNYIHCPICKRIQLKNIFDKEYKKYKNYMIDYLIETYKYKLNMHYFNIYKIKYEIDNNYITLNKIISNNEISQNIPKESQLLELKKQNIEKYNIILNNYNLLINEYENIMTELKNIINNYKKIIKEIDKLEDNTEESYIV